MAQWQAEEAAALEARKEELRGGHRAALQTLAAELEAAQGKERDRLAERHGKELEAERNRQGSGSHGSAVVQRSNTLQQPSPSVVLECI